MHAVVEVECRQVFLIKKIKINLEDCMRRIGLRQMQAGQKGSIISVDADGELGRRIRDMGLIPVRMWKLWGPRPAA